MNNSKTLRHYVFDAIDIYCTVKRELHPTRRSQIEGLKSFCQAEKLASDHSIRQCVNMLLEEIKKEQMSRWRLFSRPSMSKFAETLQQALDLYDRQVVPSSTDHHEQAISSHAPLLALEN